MARIALSVTSRTSTLTKADPWKPMVSRDLFILVDREAEAGFIGYVKVLEQVQDAPLYCFLHGAQHQTHQGDAC